MCYSARVAQDLRELSRRYGAEVAWEMYEEIFRRGVNGENLKVARALEQNSAAPTTDVERRTREYIDQYKAKRAAAWENEVFLQKRHHPCRARKQATNSPCSLASSSHILDTTGVSSVHTVSRRCLGKFLIGDRSLTPSAGLSVWSARRRLLSSASLRPTRLVSNISAVVYGRAIQDSERN
jgi:hypothetical protein